MDEQFNYEERIVAFIDILGFSQFIYKSDKDLLKAKVVYQLLSKIKNSAEKSYFSDYFKECHPESEIIAISDSLIISYPTKDYFDGAFGNVMQDVYEFIVFMLENGWLCRGAVHVGNMYHKGNLLFGKAYIDAFHLEEQEAKFPRVICSKMLMDKLSDIRALQFYTREDSDGYRYVEYLSRIDMHHPNGKLLINKIRNDIVYNLANASDNHIKEKYLWLRDYYNDSFHHDEIALC